VVNSCELSLEATIALHQTIKKVGEDIELFKFNTAISKMMTLLNFLEKEPLVSREVYIICIKLLAPFAPHVTEELWHTLGETESVHVASWPKYNESSLFASTVTYAIQIEGKLRATCVLPRDLDESRVILAVKENDQYKKYVGTFEPKKIIVIKNKLVNVVI
jgi:leucyl-tRNA synthetase